MHVESMITGSGIQKSFKNFVLDIPELKIPKGFATALVGENGAGKTTLLNLMAGVRLDFKGTFRYFESYDSVDAGNVREMIGYTAPGNYFLPQWKVSQISEISELLFDNFHPQRFFALCKKLGITADADGKKSKRVKELSDGTRMKLELAAVFARDTKMLLMDEPASPLDPLMRDHLCEMIREYLDEGAGEKSVLFSTHNISDMENVTDYVIIIEQGRVVEQGFVEELKEKYVLVKGEAEDAQAARPHMLSMQKSSYGFEGICAARHLPQLEGMDVAVEVPNLHQISVAVMKANSVLSFTQ